MFFFNDTATTEIYTLSLHDALPISPPLSEAAEGAAHHAHVGDVDVAVDHEGHGLAGELRAQLVCGGARSEEHTSELQSRQYLVCRLLLEKKKKSYQQVIFLIRHIDI